MPLPSCVRVDFRDRQSAQALTADGWREIGVCDQWSGKFEGIDRDIKRGGDRMSITSNLGEFKFNGRLWRDEKIPTFAAMNETRRFIVDVDSSRLYIAKDGDGFAIVHRCGDDLRLDLIGVRKPGRGLGRDIISSAAYHERTNWLRAGTYSDNLVARNFYASLGLTIKWSDRVFHKP